MQDCFQKFESIISDKYMPFRSLYSPGLPIDKILTISNDYNITLCEDIIQLFEWTNGHISGNVGDTRLFGGFWLLGLEGSLSHWNKYTKNVLRQHGPLGNKLPIFGEDFGVMRLVDFETGFITPMISEYNSPDEQGELPIIFDSLPKMIEHFTDCYKEEVYFFDEDDNEFIFDEKISEEQVIARRRFSHLKYWGGTGL
jgi:hypothetical protein